MLNLSDYVLIFLVLLTIFWVFFWLKYNKNILCFLSVLLWIALWIFWEKFIMSDEFKHSFWQKILDYLKDFFSDSIIIQFLLENYKIIFLVLLLLASYKIIYYLAILFFIFFKRLWENIYIWLTNKRANFKKRKKIQKDLE